MDLNEHKEKKTRKKRAFKIENGVEGLEMSIFLKNPYEPEIKITFLHLENDIYKDFVKIFICDGVETDRDVSFLVNWFMVDKMMWRFEKVNQIYEEVQTLLSYVREKNEKCFFTTRLLNLNPLYQARLPHPKYKEYKGE